MADKRREDTSLPRMLVDLWDTLVRDLFTAYRPERHYMRGPGPKWHAKHAVPAVREAAPDAIGMAA